jgi:hypothetical protein
MSVDTDALHKPAAKVTNVEVPGEKLVAVPDFLPV